MVDRATYGSLATADTFAIKLFAGVELE